MFSRTSGNQIKAANGRVSTQAQPHESPKSVLCAPEADFKLTETLRKATDFKDETAKKEFLRKRNAIYSRRKYLRKKIEVEVLKQQKTDGMEENKRLKKENQHLEKLLRAAKSMIAGPNVVKPALPKQVPELTCSNMMSRIYAKKMREQHQTGFHAFPDAAASTSNLMVSARYTADNNLMLQQLRARQLSQVTSFINHPMKPSISAVGCSSPTSQALLRKQLASSRVGAPMVDAPFACNEVLPVQQALLQSMAPVHQRFNSYAPTQLAPTVRRSQFSTNNIDTNHAQAMLALLENRSHMH